MKRICLASLCLIAFGLLFSDGIEAVFGGPPATSSAPPPSPAKPVPPQYFTFESVIDSTKASDLEREVKRRFMPAALADRRVLSVVTHSHEKSGRTHYIGVVKLPADVPANYSTFIDIFAKKGKTAKDVEADVDALKELGASISYIPCEFRRELSILRTPYQP